MKLFIIISITFYYILKLVIIYNSGLGKIDVGQNILSADDTYPDTVWRHIFFVVKVTDDEGQQVGGHGRRDVKAVSDPTISSAHILKGGYQGEQNYFFLMKKMLCKCCLNSKHVAVWYFFYNKNSNLIHIYIVYVYWRMNAPKNVAKTNLHLGLNLGRCMIKV